MRFLWFETAWLSLNSLLILRIITVIWIILQTASISLHWDAATASQGYFARNTWIRVYKDIHTHSHICTKPTYPKRADEIQIKMHQTATWSCQSFSTSNKNEKLKAGRRSTNFPILGNNLERTHDIKIMTL